ncbi:MAG: YdcH family protein [Silicimonas sp.]|nr:YdcH family protein [Silicimonas sp.]
MSHTPHELAADFPEHAERLSQLRASDGHFAKLTDDYHAVNRDVHRAETDVEPTSDEHLQEMRRKRMVLKDEIYAILTSG